MKTDDKLLDESHIVACALHLREASRCIQSEHSDISLAILQLAKSILDLHHIENGEIEQMQELVNELKGTSSEDN